MKKRGVRLTLAALVATGALAAVGAATVLFYQPRWLLTLMAGGRGRVIYYVDTQQPLIALTIDDGPDPNTTGPILDLLAEHEARATFFLIGERVAGNESVVARIVEEGHELGNHTSRDEPSIELGPAEFERSLLDTDRALSRFAEPRWMRPGSGWYDDRILEIAAEHGYRCVLASIYPYDGTFRFRKLAVWQIRVNARPGAIVALHDGGARGRTTLEVLKQVLPELRGRGYRVVTLSELVSAGSAEKGSANTYR
jgi:peptidoglycan/xylan/chitin deacetylase (PgdA/CDA1 family)